MFDPTFEDSDVLVDKSMDDIVKRFEISKARRRPPNITWEHVWSLNEAQYGLANSRFSILPTETMLHMFQFLSVPDLVNISLVCRSFKMIADRDELWKSKCKTSTKLQSKSFKQIYMDWMYEKFLRNIEREKVEALHSIYSQQFACGIFSGPLRYPDRPSGQHYFIPIGGFKQHPNESQYMTIQLSVDIDKTARELISLLGKASKFYDEWRQPTVTKQMIVRYYRFMELKSSHPNLLLIPTLDIEIVWQTHLLRPIMYQEDCLRLFHRVIDHSLLINDIEQFLKEQAFVDTCKLYEERFHEQYCPLLVTENEKQPDPKYEYPVFGLLTCIIPIYSYWDKTHFTFSLKPTADNDANPFSFTEADIILDGNWFQLCKRFMNEMLFKIPFPKHARGNPDYIDLSSSAMERLKKSYERFLYLSTKYQPTNGYQFVHPTYAIDIIWHSHMQEPMKYASDCNRLIGHIIDHVPWPSVDGDKMKNSCGDANIAWTKEFDSELSTDHLYNTTKEAYEYSDEMYSELTYEH